MTIKPYQAPWLQKAEKIQLLVGEKYGNFSERMLIGDVLLCLLQTSLVAKKAHNSRGFTGL